MSHVNNWKIIYKGCHKILQPEAHTDLLLVELLHFPAGTSEIVFLEQQTGIF